MKTVMLMRHAKSSHADSSLKDFDRPLAKQGRNDVPLMAQFAKEAKVLPGHIESSPALRAKQTTELFVKATNLEPSLINWNKNLYFGGARDYLKTIQQMPENVNRIMVIGHNPLLEETVSLLCNREGTFAVRMPAGGLACIEHPAIKWSQIKPGTARFQWMMIPKLLKKLSK